MLVNGLIETSWKSFRKVSDGERIVDVEMGVANKFFELHNIAIGILRIHFEALHDDSPCFLFLQNIGVLSAEGYNSAVIQPWIPRVYSFLINLVLQPTAHGLNPFGHIVPLNVCEEEKALLIRVGDDGTFSVNACVDPPKSKESVALSPNACPTWTGSSWGQLGTGMESTGLRL